MKQLLKKKITWIIAALTIVVLVGWRIQSAKTASSKKESTYTVQRQTIKETLSISGSIDAKEKATLRFQTSGLLSWVAVKEGDRVSQYQAIAGLDQQELQKTLQKYLLTYESERRDFEQTKEEYRQPAQGYWGLSWDQRNELDRVLEKAQFDLTSAVLDVELKNIALKYATLYSPIRGIVTSVGSPLAGVYVTPTQAEFEIINPDTFYLSVLPDQSEVTKLTASMAASIVFDAFPEDTIQGSISSIALVPKTGESNTVYETKVDFPVQNTAYRYGMTADVTFTVAEKPDVLAIPISYLKTENGKVYVNTVKNNTKTKTYVTVGIEGDDLVEITGGLAEGDILYD